MEQGRGKAKSREFVDEREHGEVMDAYYGITESYTGENTEEVKLKLKKLIEKDPYFLDPYLLLMEILNEEENFEQGEEVLNLAYQKAMELILDKDRNWPDILEWGWLENRHIIRTIVNKALFLWAQGENEKALELLRKLLKTNPNDNVGARDYILAIRMGLSFDDFEDRFDRGGFYDSELSDWFQENYKKFPDEFDWWEKDLGGSLDISIKPTSLA